MTKKEKFLMKMFDKSQTIINNKMDMINYLRLHEEQINIKCLIFNDIQSICLNYTDRPKLYEKNHFNKIINPGHENINEIVDYYVKKSCLNKEDDDIFKLLSKTIQDNIKRLKLNN